MVISDLSVRRPVFAAVVSILLTIVGIVAFFSLSVREYPDTDPPIVSVSTQYIGAAASVIENRITQPLEERLSGIEGIQTITSRSRDGGSDISIEFSPRRNIDSAANDVRDRVGSALRDLPENVLPPEVRKVDTDAFPILFLVVSRPGWTQLQISDFVDRNLVDRFATIDGVSRVNIGGQAKPSMRIWLQAGKLAAYQLTPGDVEAALRSQNVELPAGRIESVQQNVTLRVDRKFVTPESFAKLVIGRGADGYLVRLGDVARIEEGAENPYSRYRLNGAPAVGLGIIRQSGANTLAVADAAKKLAIDVIPDLPTGMTITVGSDDSQFIGRAIKNVYRTLAEAAVLVVLVIFLFLGSWRATLIPAVTVPICLLSSFTVLWLAGFSINLLTLLALVLSIGLVVDDAIVVLENVYRRIEEGEDPLVAAYRGTRQVGFAVISTTLVVCSVFVPICFLAGQTGLLFRELAVAMIAAVAFSGFLALSLTPMLCSKMLRHEKRGRLTGWVDDRFNALENFYIRRLDWALRKPLFPLLAVAAFLIAGGLGYSTLRTELAPAEDQGVIQANLNAPEGTGFAQMDAYMLRAQKQMLKLLGDGPVASINERVPGGFNSTDDFNNGSFTIYLRPWEDRTVKTQQVAEEINKILAKQSAVRGNAQVRSALGRGRSQPVNLVIAGTTYEGLVTARNRIFAAAAANPGLINMDSDYKESKPQLRVDVDTNRAGDLGVSVASVSQALQTLLGSSRVSTYVDRGREYRVIMQAEEGGRSTLAALASIYVRSRDGKLVPLSNLVTTREYAGPRDLGRFDKLRAITLTAGLAPGYSLTEALSFLEDQARQSPEIIAIGYRGDSQALKETGGSIMIVFFLTILVVYLVLAAQFESFVHPAVIITTVPLAVAGGLIGLVVSGTTLNLYSQIGIVMLVGLAAKNGILIVEFANQLRDAGATLDEAIRKASARRLRAILMTSIATVAGAVPLVTTGGAGGASRASIGVVVIFGVSLATLITLFLIPILYTKLAARTGSPNAVGRKLDEALGATQPAE
jgi:multidrug efflux pump